MHIGPLAGIGLTAYKDGSIRSSGVITATTYYGSGANLTGIDATQIQTGNTSVQTVDTGSDGHVKVTTEGTERLRIDTTGRLLLGTQRTHSDQSYYDDITINNSNGSSASGGTGITLISDNASWGALLLGDEDDHDVGGFKYSHGSNYMEVRTNGSEKLRIGSSGEIGVGGGGSISFGSAGQFLKSGGNSAGCQWASPAVRKVHPVYYSNTSAAFNSQGGTQIGSTGTHYPASARIGGNFTKVSSTSKVLVQGVLTYAMNTTNIHGFCVWIGGDESNYVNTGGDTRMWDFYTTRNGNICVWPFSYIFNTAYSAGTVAAYAAPCVNGTRTHTGELNPNPATNSVNNQSDAPGKDCHSCLTVIEFEP